MSNHVEPFGRRCFLMVRTRLPEAPRLFPAFDDRSRKARNVTAGVKTPNHPNYFSEITSVAVMNVPEMTARHTARVLRPAAPARFETDFGIAFFLNAEHRA
uniref:hypothetical protein n=1 Tax=Nonomuraea bangladeshensis TaxID=404385 RepID=UPI003F494AE3